MGNLRNMMQAQFSLVKLLTWDEPWLSLLCPLQFNTYVQHCSQIINCCQLWDIEWQITILHVTGLCNNLLPLAIFIPRGYFLLHTLICNIGECWFCVRYYYIVVLGCKDPSSDSCFQLQMAQSVGQVYTDSDDASNDEGRSSTVHNKNFSSSAAQLSRYKYCGTTAPANLHHDRLLLLHLYVSRGDCVAVPLLFNAVEVLATM